MFSEEQRLEIKEAIDGTVADFVDKLPSKVNEILTGSVLNVLGMKKGWGGGSEFEVNSVNGTRSLLAELVKRAVKDECEAQIHEVVKKCVFEIGENVRMTHALKKEAASLYRSELRDEMVRAVREKAADDAKGIVNEIKNDSFLLALGPDSIEIDDPNSFEGRLGKQLLIQKVLDLGLVDGGDPVERILNRGGR